MREDGYYWVKWNGKWIIAEWSINNWYCIESALYKDDNYFDEIDERRITRDENK